MTEVNHLYDNYPPSHPMEQGTHPTLHSHSISENFTHNYETTYHPLTHQHVYSPHSLSHLPISTMEYPAHHMRAPHWIIYLPSMFHPCETALALPPNPSLLKIGYLTYSSLDKGTPMDSLPTSPGMDLTIVPLHGKIKSLDDRNFYWNHAHIPRIQNFTHLIQHHHSSLTQELLDLYPANYYPPHSPLTLSSYSIQKRTLLFNTILSL